MRKLETVIGKVFPINRSHIDTDQIAPARWLQKIERTGYEDALFENWRKDPDFVLNDPLRRGGKFILAGDDYGCGSSRENAVWAMRDYGIEAVISTSIADIHRNNLPAGPIVPAIVSEDDWQLLYKISSQYPEIEFQLDVTHKTIHAREIVVPFSIEESARASLLSGIDTIGKTLALESMIRAYEQHRPAWMPTT